MCRGQILSFYEVITSGCINALNSSKFLSPVISCLTTWWWMISILGILLMVYFSQSSLFSTWSTSTLQILIFQSKWWERSWSIGHSIWQGPHRSAKKSTTKIFVEVWMRVWSESDPIISKKSEGWWVCIVWGKENKLVGDSNQCQEIGGDISQNLDDGYRQIKIPSRRHNFKLYDDAVFVYMKFNPKFVAIDL